MSVRRSSALIVAAAMTLGLHAGSARAEGKQGDVVQTDTIGVPFVTHKFDTGATSDIGNEFVLSEFVGLHYFFVDRLRVGMNLQFSEQIVPSVTSPGQTPAEISADGSTLRTFALLPQIGWDFWGPMFAAFVFTVAPWSYGSAKFDFGVQGVLGVGIPLANRVKLTAAVEIPANFVVHQTLGVTPLLGLAFRL